MYRWQFPRYMDDNLYISRQVDLVYRAIQNRGLRTLRDLIERQGVAVDIFNPNLLIGAIGQNYLPVVRYLVEVLRLPIDAADYLGNTPLHYAAQFNFPEMVNYLLRMGANPNIENRAGYTPIQLTRSERIEAALMGRGAVRRRPSWMIERELLGE